ncbi:heme lyase CcmF/NrfE family subunit [Marinihelvus fidelis]|uniref:Heme lyase CcmF/NrfE family subunit n=1 Tax=Marinihelvus fidelis TaxID=2613842 RepID=A0A5N0T6H5_9GAMM|nr:heme lyase CcmF/NrfE family subunit [Marinihelvus fidelis]KAA9130563.1 heme lyase CcmF/NrfE family subunit [Marinihelvus fidelis]
MIAELGQVTLVCALLVALFMGVVPVLGVRGREATLLGLAPTAALVQFVLVLLAYVLLTTAFVTQDFSVEYVARNSNSQLPLYYRFTAVWGAHEGSLLLWQLILVGWTLAVAVFSRSLPAEFRATVLAVLGWVAVGFCLFILYTSNPFERILPPPVEGLDLNPLLQDPGMIIHPPMLYMGYVGFAIPFAFAVAALLRGEVTRQWVRWTRPWTHVAWAFLTLGIALGSWWAYYELGWGGWWFWDPVENASFMPWLVGTALLHSQAVTEKTGAFRNWTLLLAIAAFSLSLLGTFLVRSGVLTSVHAFASDPTRGLFILGYLVIVVGGSLTLFSVRAPKMMMGSGFAGISRESLLLVNNLVLAVICAMVLLGTLYPLAVDAMGAGKISVGPPYFALLFSLLLVPLVVALPLGVFARFKRDRLGRLLKQLRWPATLAAVAGALTWWWLPEPGIAPVTGVAGAAWLIAASLAWPLKRLRGQGQQAGFTRQETAMTLAHFGLGIFMVGISLAGVTSAEKHIRMAPGDRFELGGYTFEFGGTRQVQGPNYRADEGDFMVSRDQAPVTTLKPQKRHYLRDGQVMTEAAIDPGLGRDLYVSLGEPLGEGAWAVSLYIKPFVRWVWLGALFMFAGGLLAATDRRYRGRKATPDSGAGAAA